MQGLNMRLPGEVTDDTMERFYEEDDWLDRNTQFLFDSRNPICWPKQAGPVNDDVLYNLMPGQPHAKFTLLSAGGIGWREDGWDFPGLNNSVIELGTDASWRLASLGNPDVCYIFWLKRETGFLTNNYQMLMGRGLNTNADSCEFFCSLGNNGVDLSAGFSNGTTTPKVSVPPATLTAKLNTTIQVAWAVEGGKAKIYFNGALVQEVNFVKPFHNPVAGAPPVPAHKILVGYGTGGPRIKGIVKRFGMTVLPAGTTAASRVLQDWALNHVALGGSA